MQKKDKNLGPLLATFRGPALHWGEVLFVFAPAVLAVLAPLLYGLQRASVGYAHYGAAAALAWSYPWFMLAAFALLPLLFLTLRRLFRRHSSIAVHQNGLGLRFPPFFERDFRWTQIAGIASGDLKLRFLAFSLHAYPCARLYPTLGKAIRLEGRVGDLPALIEMAKGQLFPRLLPAMQREFQAGRGIHLGPLAIHPQGLTLAAGKRHPERETIPWEQVGAFAVRDGFLVIELKKGKPLSIAVSEIPNLELLLQIVDWGINP